MTPEDEARVKIDKQLNSAGWDVVSRGEYTSEYPTAIREALMQGNHESDYLLFIDGKAVAVLEAKREENPLGDDVQRQAEGYASHPQSWYRLWFPNQIPLVYLANGEKIYFKNLLQPESDYEPLSEMDSPKKMLRRIGQTSAYGALPRLDQQRLKLRDCQYRAEINFEKSLKQGKKKSLAVLATGSGKTYLACLASYRLLNYTPVNKILFLVDRNNLARQTESEFSIFDRTERREPMGTLYKINRLKNIADAQNADVVISTMQKLFAVLTGADLTSSENEDAEDEFNTADEEKENAPAVELGDNLKLRPDHFQLIIVDECHRSIYGKWKAVLDYFSGACVLGLTATPTPEANAYFDCRDEKDYVENYTYEKSVIDGVNVPFRVYRIKTNVTEHGGVIDSGTKVAETVRKTGEKNVYVVPDRVDYQPNELDRSVVDLNQIKTVLEEYKKIVYEKLYPAREKRWEYIPKTLIFAKDENHASNIVEVAKQVFGVEFDGGEVPENFVQKITYSVGDSNALIRDFRTEKEFRIAVTVTLVATGTDVKPLEVVLFMKDVHSSVLYTQMKGRGCRVLLDDKLREVSPNADTKDCFYIVDAIGVTESEKVIPPPGDGSGETYLSLEHLLERLAHNELSDENLCLLRDYCARIHTRYENNPLFGRHLSHFIDACGFSPKNIAERIQHAVDSLTLPPFVSSSEDNSERQNVVSPLISSVPARKELLKLQKGYVVVTQSEQDKVVYSGFSKETAKSVIENFEKYLNDNKDSVEALRILYNSEDVVITHSMLLDLQDSFLAENRQYNIEFIWNNYKTIDEVGAVDELDKSANVKALTNLIQIVRFAYKKSPQLASLVKGFAKRFNLYCGQLQRELTDDQKEVMRKIALYIVADGGFSSAELNDTDPDLWRQGVSLFSPPPVLEDEIQTLARFLLKAA